MTHQQRLLLLLILGTLLRSMGVFAQTANGHASIAAATLKGSTSGSPASQTWKQVAEFTASDGASLDEFGNSVSASGNTAVVGAPFADGGTGAAYVFVKSSKSGASMTQTAKLKASDGATGDTFGWSVAISGSTIVVGALGHTVGSNPQQGAVYIFVEPANGWADMTETAELTASDGAPSDWLGSSVAIGVDTVAAGAVEADNGGPGAVYVFVEPPNGWINSTETAKLTPLNGTPGLGIGRSVGIAGSAVVSGSNSSAVYMFVEPANGWDNMTETTQLSGGSAALNAVAISGTTVAAGSYLASVYGEKGAVFVFQKPKLGWATATVFKPVAELTASNGQVFDELGYSVSINGNTIVAGAPNAPCHLVRRRCNPIGPGAAYVFVKPGGGWKNATETAELMSANGQAGDQFGTSVANIGNIVLAGAINANSGDGAAYVFAPVVNSSAAAASH
jgi:hypothetical protein